MKFLVNFVCFVRVFDHAIAKNVFDLSKLSISEEDGSKGIETKHFKRSGDSESHQYPQLLEAGKQSDMEESHKFETFSTELLNVASEKEDVSIFTYYLRDNYDFIHSNPKLLQSLVIFIPTDLAVKRLSAKPWEFPTVINPGMDEREADEVSKNNILNFVKSHLINVTDANYKLPDLGELVLKSMSNNNITIKNKNGVFYVSAQGLSKWHKIFHTTESHYGDQTITFIVLDGTLDWPERY